MSSALVRQSLEFVDPDVGSGKKKRRAPSQRRPVVQDSKITNKPKRETVNESKQEKIKEEVIKQLLELSKPTVDNNLANKIVKRAVKGRPVTDKKKTKKEKQKSILFPDEDFDTFEEQPFCS